MSVSFRTIPIAQPGLWVVFQLAYKLSISFIVWLGKDCDYSFVASSSTVIKTINKVLPLVSINTVLYVVTDFRFYIAVNLGVYIVLPIDLLQKQAVAYFIFFRLWMRLRFC